MATENNNFPIYYKDDKGNLLFTLPSSSGVPRVGESVTTLVWKSKINEGKPTWVTYYVHAVDTEVGFVQDNPNQFFLSKTVTVSRQASGISDKN